MNLTIRIRTDRKDKEGRHSLYFQAIKNRKSLKCPINEKVELKYWAGNNGAWIREKGKNAHPNGLQFNMVLSRKLQEANKIILSFKLQDKQLDWETFKRTLNRGLDVTFKMMHQEFMESKNTQEKPISKSTIRMLNSRYNKVKAFQKDLRITEIDLDWIERFIYFLRTELNNETNTRAKALHYVKGVLNIAKKQQVIDTNPFDLLEIKTETNSRIYLNFEEVQLLEDLYNSDFFHIAKPGAAKVLQQFLFACFTGIDYGDISTLTPEHIKTVEGIQVIDRLRAKGDSEAVKDLPYTVPISDKAKVYLPKLPKSGLIFKTISNQKTNVQLKVAIKMCSIHKKISFHCARHTFATLSLNLGVPLEILQKWMGHSSLIQTEHYAKMISTTSSKVVSIWNDFAEKQSTNNK